MSRLDQRRDTWARKEVEEGDLIMEPDSILVTVLMVGVLAILVWFEVNSRRNDARKRLNLTLPQSDPHKKAEVQSETEGRKAA